VLTEELSCTTFLAISLEVVLDAQYRLNVSWQSLASQSSHLETRFSILKNFENRVSRRVSRILRVENGVSSRETNELVTWVISRGINQTHRLSSIVSVIIYRSNKCVKKWGASIPVLCNQIMTNNTHTFKIFCSFPLRVNYPRNKSESRNKSFSWSSFPVCIFENSLFLDSRYSILYSWFSILDSRISKLKHLEFWDARIEFRGLSRDCQLTFDWYCRKCFLLFNQLLFWRCFSNWQLQLFFCLHKSCLIFEWSACCSCWHSYVTFTIILFQL